MPDHDFIDSVSGDRYTVEQDETAGYPGVMIDRFYCREAPTPIENDIARFVESVVGTPRARSIDDAPQDEADTYIYIPASIVRQVGEALIAMADECGEEWSNELREMMEDDDA